MERENHGDVDYDDHGGNNGGGDDEEENYDDDGEGQEGRDKLL